MKLLGSDNSPFVRKVRVVMAEKKIDYQYEQQDVWAADSAIQQSNPLGKIPCLILDDGGAVFESRVIVEYLDNLTPVHRLIPPAGRARVDVRCWEALADGLLDAAVLIRLEHSQRAEGERSQRWVDRQYGKIDPGSARCPPVWPSTPGAATTAIRWPTSPPAAPCRTSTSDSRRSTGARATPISPGSPTS